MDNVLLVEQISKWFWIGSNASDIVQLPNGTTFLPISSIVTLSKDFVTSIPLIGRSIKYQSIFEVYFSDE